MLAAQLTEEALENFRLTWELSEQQPAAAREYPDWIGNWKRSLEKRRKHPSRKALRTGAAGSPETARIQERTAGALRAKRLALP